MTPDRLAEIEARKRLQKINAEQALEIGRLQAQLAEANKVIELGTHAFWYKKFDKAARDYIKKYPAQEDV